MRERGAARLKPATRTCIYGQPAAGSLPHIAGVSLGKGHPFIHVARANRFARDGSRNHRERLSKAGMVDLLGMFRRRTAKRSPPGFARTRADITALGDTMGELLTSPVRDAPPIVRDAPPTKPHAPRTEKPRPRAKTNGGGGPAAGPPGGRPGFASRAK